MQGKNNKESSEASQNEDILNEDIESTMDEVNKESDADLEDDMEEELDEVSKLTNEVAELKDKYLRLYSDFENYKRRTNKERLDLFKSASEDTIKALLPVLDDFDRAEKAFETSTDANALAEGVKLVSQKLIGTLSQKGLNAYKVIGEPFDSDLHEAIVKTPAPSDDLKGKVIDEIEKGYKLHDKVIRFAKVVIGE